MGVPKKYISRLINDSDFRTICTAAGSLLINIAYAVYNLFLGVTTASMWFVTMCFYYSLLGAMRFHAVITAVKGGNGNKMMKRDGAALLMLTPALCGTAILTVRQERIIAYGTITMITIAAYTFFRITTAVINCVKVRKTREPVLMTIRNINAADAAMSVLPMQTSMIASFDGGEMSIPLMTGLTGGGICAVFWFLGISMIIAAVSAERKK